MSESQNGEPEHEPEHHALGKNRIEALSDGIFAVAMTLLVLDFQVPKLPHNAPNVEVAPALLHLWPSFISYVVSFLSLGVFWVGHHNMYHGVRRADRVLLWLNIFFFMFVTCLPFSTSILNAFPQTQVALLFFGGTLTIIGWLLYVQYSYACTQPGMFADFVTPAYRRVVRSRFLTYPTIATCTMLICFWSIPISLTIYLLLLPLYMIPDKIDRRLAKAGRMARWNFLSQMMGGETDTDPETRPATEKTARRLKLSVGILIALVLIGAWAAFRPELTFVNMRAHDTFEASGPPTGSVVLATGRFHGVAHPTVGNVALYDTGNGRGVLRFTNFQTSNGPDVYVYLIAAPDATDNTTVTTVGYVDIGKMKGNLGDQNYVVPESVDLGKYRAVTLWCHRFHVNFATAPLKLNAH